MLKPKSTRRYIALEKLFASEKYKEWLIDLKKHYKKFGLPLPDNPIQESKCLCHLSGWERKMFEKCEESLNSKERKDALEKIHGGAGKYVGHEQIQRKSEVDAKYIIYPIGEYIRYLIREIMGISQFENPDDFEVYTNFIQRKILHGADKYYDTAELRFERKTSDKKDTTLWLKIEPHTTIEDILNNWKFIESHKSQLPEYKKRYAEHKNLARDVRVMEVYNQLKKDRVMEKDKEFFDRPRSLASRISAMIDAEFGDVSEYVINKVISENKKEV